MQTMKPAASNRAKNPVDTAASSPVSSHIGFLLNLAHRRFRQAIVDALDGTGLNPGQIAILGALSADHGLSQAELGEITGIEKSSMVLLVDALESSGWVERRPHATDRRAHALELTAGGKRRLQTIGPRLQAAEDGMLTSLTATQRRALLTLLQRIAKPE